MKKRLSTMVSALLIAGLLAGCGSSAGQSSTTTNSSKAEDSKTSENSSISEESVSSSKGGDRTVIKVTRWGEITENDAEYEMVQTFNAENEEIEIVYDVVPGDGYGDRLTTSFSSGEGYDVFASGEGDFYKWVGTSVAVPLDDYVSKDSEWVSKINPAFMEIGNIQGSQYYIPRDYNTICLWYNKDVFDANKVDYPTADWTWDDLEAAAKKLTVKNDDGSYASFGFNAQSWEYAALSYFKSIGLDIMNEDGTKADGYLNSPEFAAALEKYVGYSDGDDRISPSAADIDTYGDATAMLANGNLAMTLNGGWARDGLESSKVNYGSEIVPGNHESYLCASAYAISANCKNPDAAWEVIKALTGEEASELRSENTSALPTIDSLLEVRKATIGENNLGMVDQIEYSVQPVGLRSELGGNVVKAFKDALERVVYKDGETQTILDEAVAEAMEGSAE